MSSKLKQAILNQDKGKINELIDNFSLEGNWSLISIVDDLAPLMLMEANLKYGNVHMIKMSLFLREFTQQGFFSRETEKELIRLISLNLSERHFTSITAKSIGYKEDKVYPKTVDKLKEEIKQGNVHNAFYYAQGLLKYQPKTLAQVLIMIGADSIPDTLGHSVSCFYPVVRDYIRQDSPHAATALLSYIMYLSRFDRPGHKRVTMINMPEDWIRLTKRCASGEGIVNLHHMITLAVYDLLDDNSFQDVPYQILLNWLDDKEVDHQLEEKFNQVKTDLNLPINYQQFAESFNFADIDESLNMYFVLLKEHPEWAVDWLFRLYTSYYKSGWDPHYFTGLYAAICLYNSPRIKDEPAGRMAIYQAVKYFKDGMID